MRQQELAATIIAYFLLPYAKLGPHRIGEAVADRVGRDAADHVSEVTMTMWSRVSGAFSLNPDGATILEQFEGYPEEMAAYVEHLLSKALERDTKLAAQLQELAKSPVPGAEGATFQVIAETFWHVKGAQIHTGGVGSIELGQRDAPESELDDVEREAEEP